MIRRACCGLWVAVLSLLLISGNAWAIKQRVVREPEERYIREVWLDPVRQRHVNVRIALPTRQTLKQRAGPMPVLLFSAPQGFRWGGLADHYEDLSQDLLRRGIVTVTVAHYDLEEPLSPNERFADVYPGIQTGTRRDAAVDRYEDMIFVLERLQTQNQRRADDWPVLDLDRLAVSGHSSGTLTALHLSGLPVRDRTGKVFATHRDPRIKAFVLYSYPLAYRGPSREDLKQVGVVAGLHVAGSNDHPQYRQSSYRSIHRAPQYWLVAEGWHNIGSVGSEKLVLEVTGSFLDVHLLGKADQRGRLTADALAPFGPSLKQFSSKGATWLQPPDQRDFVDWARDTLPGARWLHDLAIAHERARGSTAK